MNSNLNRRDSSRDISPQLSDSFMTHWSVDNETSYIDDEDSIGDSCEGIPNDFIFATSLPLKATKALEHSPEIPLKSRTVILNMSDLPRPSFMTPSFMYLS
jgi:hypothetical protein